MNMRSLQFVHQSAHMLILTWGCFCWTVNELQLLLLRWLISLSLSPTGIPGSPGKRGMSGFRGPPGFVGRQGAKGYCSLMGNAVKQAQYSQYFHFSFFKSLCQVEKN